MELRPTGEEDLKMGSFNGFQSCSVESELPTPKGSLHAELRFYFHDTDGRVLSK